MLICFIETLNANEITTYICNDLSNLTYFKTIFNGRFSLL